MNQPKPITIKHREFVAMLDSLIANSDLPYFVIESVLKDYIASVKMLADKQLKNDIAAYSSNLKEGAADDQQK